MFKACKKAVWVGSIPITSRDDDITRSEGTGLSGSGNLLLKDDVTDLGEITIGEEKTDVAFEDGEKRLVLVADNTTNHGVLSHQQDTLAANAGTDLLHVAGTDVISTNNHDFVVLVEQLAELIT